MKNVAITLDDAIASRARVEAASRGKSLSKFLGELIERGIGREIEQAQMTDLEAIQKFLSGPGIPAKADHGKNMSSIEAMEKFLSGPDLNSFGGEGRLPSRQDIYDERINELVRRYERSNLCDR